MPPLPIDQIPLPYGRTKRLGEEDALRANGSMLKVLAFRYGPIYGLDDPLTVRPVYRDAAVGAPFGKQNYVYAENAAYAQICGARKLLIHGEEIGGHVYYISDCAEPKRTDQFGTQLWNSICEERVKRFTELQENGSIPPTAKLETRKLQQSPPIQVAWAIAIVMECISWLTCRYLAYRYRAIWAQLNRDLLMQNITITFSCARAIRELDYQPLYSENQALHRIGAQYAHMELSGTSEDTVAVEALFARSL